VIGLRVLHLATAIADAKAGDVLTMMSWLRANGHVTALVAGGEGEISGVEVIHYRAKAPAWWMGGKQHLIAKATAWNPDLIHLHGIQAFPAARAIARRLSLPVVVSMAPLVPPEAARVLHEPEISWVLVPTEAHRAHYLGRERLDRDRVCVLPFAVDAKLCATCPSRPASAQVSVAARVRDAVSAEQLIEAIAVLRRDEVPVSLIMVQSGSEETDEAIAEVIARVHGASWCEMVGERPTRDLMSMCDILVHPDTTDGPAETAIVAMACGRPVVATAVGGLPELVREGHAGLLVPPNDPTALACAISRLVRDPALRKQLGAGAMLFASQRYDIHVIGPATQELYHAALIARQSASAKAEGSRAYHRRITDPKAG
jgi:glycosyltransferase involved in cell wall biosynthesis